MDNVVEYELDGGGRVLVEVDPGSNGELPASSIDGVTRKARDSFGKALETIRPIVDQAATVIKKLEARPEQVEIEFGLKLSGELGVILAKGEAEANLVVKVTFKARD